MKNINWNRALEAPPEQFHENVLSVLHTLPEQEEIAMKRIWNAKRIGLLAAAVVVLSIGAAAATNLGFIRSDWRNTESLADAAAVEEVLKSGEVEGIPTDTKFLETYSNGFTFVKGTLDGTEARADDNPTVHRYQCVSSCYERDGAAVHVDVSPVIAGITDRMRGDQLQWGDVTLYTLEQDYLVVPENYEKTPEQLEAEAAGSLMFSYDDSLDGPEAMVHRYVAWLQGGALYSISATDSMTELSELVSMAQELIDS